MPTKRGRRTRAFSAITLRSLSPNEFLCLTCGFRPDAVSRWPSWERYLTDYESVREELLDRQRRRHGANARLPFAERARVFVQAHGMGMLRAGNFDDDGEKFVPLQADDELYVDPEELDDDDHDNHR